MHVPKVASLVLVSVATLVGLPKTASATGPPAVRVIPISYRAHDGLMRRADVIVPAITFPERRSRSSSRHTVAAWAPA